ncbi:MAG: xanthine dehydrogenase family protein [Rhodospirillales bacterium]
MRGVRAVLTGADLLSDGLGSIGCSQALKNKNGSNRHDPPRYALAVGQVRHVGDPVAFVVAATLQAARNGAEAATVEYDPLASVTDPVAAIAAGAPAVWPDAVANTCFEWGLGDEVATEAAFARAAHATRLKVVNNRIVVASMEPRAALAEWMDNRCHLVTNTQGGWQIRGTIARGLGVAESALRIVTPDVGGGFGMKGFAYPEHVLICHAARKLQRPVKWASSRTEAFVSDTHGRDNVTEGELALDADGKFLALRVSSIANMGAYLSQFGPFIPTYAGSGVLAGVYGFEAIRVDVRGVYTHTVPVTRIAGRGGRKPTTSWSG